MDGRWCRAALRALRLDTQPHVQFDKHLTGNLQGIAGRSYRRFEIAVVVADITGRQALLRFFQVRLYQSSLPR